MCAVAVGSRHGGPKGDRSSAPGDQSRPFNASWGPWGPSASGRRADVVTWFPGQTNPKKGLIQALELGKVTGSKAPRLKVQSPGGREGENPAEGVVSEV